MTYRDVYIGDLDDPNFHWDGGNWRIGNIPRRKSPFFPSVMAVPFWSLLRKIKAGELDGKQTDWGGWVARATKKQIHEFIASVYVPKYTCVLSDLEYKSSAISSPISTTKNNTR
jgi:hypothetical protein